jgi:DNA-directed RNA polymerase specialized sigma24 family protein
MVQIKETEGLGGAAEANEWNPALLEKEDRDLLGIALDRLPRKMAEVMRLLYLEELPRETVAEQLGISLNTVYRQEKRAKTRLNGIRSGTRGCVNALFPTPDGKKCPKKSGK